MSNKIEKASIAVSCFNCSSFVYDCLVSIVKQTYQNFEVVIVDDNSDDDSLLKISKFISANNLKDFFRIYKHDKNAGYGRTLKDAIENCQNEVILVLDMDDAITKNAVYRSIKLHNNFPNASLIHSNRYDCNSIMRINGKTNDTPIPKGKTYLECNYIGDPLIDVKVSHLKSIKKSKYDKTPGIDETLVKNVDKDLILKMEEVGELKFTPEILYYRRNHKNNLTKNFKKKNDAYKSYVLKSKIKMINNAIKRRNLHVEKSLLERHLKKEEDN